VGERSLHTREVAGSKPAAPILRRPCIRRAFVVRGLRRLCRVAALRGRSRLPSSSSARSTTETMTRWRALLRSRGWPVAVVKTWWPGPPIFPRAILSSSSPSRRIGSSLMGASPRPPGTGRAQSRQPRRGLSGRPHPRFGDRSGSGSGPCPRRQQRRKSALELRSKLPRKLHRGFDLDTSDRHALNVDSEGHAEGAAI
jgi:hypothetical protein